MFTLYFFVVRTTCLGAPRMSEHGPGGGKLKLHDGQVCTYKNNAVKLSAVEARRPHLS